jgi:hypothetical protein
VLDNPIKGNIGVAWFSEDTYIRARAAMADADALPPTFREWHDMANKGVKTLREQGFVVEQALIDPDAFPSWCTQRRLSADAKARIRFAAEYAGTQWRKHR